MINQLAKIRVIRGKRYLTKPQHRKIKDDKGAPLCSSVKFIPKGETYERFI